MRISMLAAAVVAALVGYGSTIALVLAAARAVGASEAETASWVLAVCLVKAAGSAGLSLWARVPVVLAWSTPGAALIAASSGITMRQAVGAFVLSGVLVAATGAIGPLGKLVARIPDGIAAGMLAGVLLPFCLKGTGALQAMPVLGLAMLAMFLGVRLMNPALAVLAALVVGGGLAFLGGFAAFPALAWPWPVLTFVAPEMSAHALVGLGLPLYLVTMASQNLPGFAILRAAGYEPPVRAALGVTGGLSVLGGLFGAHPISMAAITAAICLGPDVHPDKDQRWKVGLVYAGAWVALGLFGPVLLALVQALPGEVMTLLVALALLGPLMGALAAAFARIETRFAATITLAVTGSGVAIAGVGGAFWGLVAGLAVAGLEAGVKRLR
jgi:benzoate membrane transport protein